MHLKKNWPSALRRIAALEQEIIALRGSADDNEDSVADDAHKKNAAAVVDRRDGDSDLYFDSRDLDGDCEFLWGKLRAAFEHGTHSVGERDVEKIGSCLRIAMTLLKKIEAPEAASLFGANMLVSLPPNVRVHFQDGAKQACDAGRDSASVDVGGGPDSAPVCEGRGDAVAAASASKRCVGDVIPQE